MQAGGPHTISVSGKNALELSDVLVGEVWIGSGQSNMQFTVNGAVNGEQEIAAANFPRIRLFTVERKVASKPQAEVVTSGWKICSPETVGGFSAVAYFFGRDLHQQLDVPVGLIHTSWGGTPAEAWTSRSALEAEPVLVPILKRWDAMLANYRKSLERYKADVAKWVDDSTAAEEAGRHLPPMPKHPGDDLRGSPHRPSGLYNAMIAPLIPVAFRGAIWYQGESNSPRAYQYRTLFPAMIQDWRSRWHQGDFPFLFVQLANFEPKSPRNGTWAELREAQLRTLSLPNTGMAVIIDIGDPVDIHPKNKQGVGRRLALAARAIAYGQKIEYFGPMYDSMKVEGGKVRLAFTHAEALATRDGGSPQGFIIVGADKAFVPALAKIEGRQVVVWSDEVKEPAAVRYGWSDNPADANLVNKAGLPASPFRTDDWPGITVDEK